VGKKSRRIKRGHPTRSGRGRYPREGSGKFGLTKNDRKKKKNMREKKMESTETATGIAHRGTQKSSNTTKEKRK